MAVIHGPRLVRAERQDIQRQNDAAIGVGSATDMDSSEVRWLQDAALIRYTLSSEPNASNLGALEREVRMLKASETMTFEQYSQSFPLLSRIFPAPTKNEAEKAFAEVDLCRMYGSVEERQAIWLPAILEAKATGAKVESERKALIAVSTHSNTEALARYQAALDNEWYKAMRAFRDARQHRLSTIDVV